MKVAVITVAISAILYVAHRVVVPGAFVSAGRGSIGQETLTVNRVQSSWNALSEQGLFISAGDGHKYVSIDVTIKGGWKAFDIYDFQLVREKVREQGREQNLGNNLENDYFHWTPLDNTGNPLPSADDSTSEARVRLNFRVPSKEGRGYLFYWGEYFGPLEFES